jgi:hypothetical protein
MDSRNGALLLQLPLFLVAMALALLALALALISLPFVWGWAIFRPAIRRPEKC